MRCQHIWAGSPGVRGRQDGREEEFTPKQKIDRKRLLFPLWDASHQVFDGSLKISPRPLASTGSPVRAVRWRSNVAVVLGFQSVRRAPNDPGLTMLSCTAHRRKQLEAPLAHREILV